MTIAFNVKKNDLYATYESEYIEVIKQSEKKQLPSKKHWIYRNKCINALHKSRKVSKVLLTKAIFVLAFLTSVAWATKHVRL